MSVALEPYETPEWDGDDPYDLKPYEMRWAGFSRQLLGKYASEIQSRRERDGFPEMDTKSKRRQRNGKGPDKQVRTDQEPILFPKDGS